MNFLLKPNQYSKFMVPYSMFAADWQHMVERPPVIADKDKAPLAIYGTLANEPEIDAESGRPRCTGTNIESIYALQLDYDSGVTIEQFREKYSGMRFTLYTSYSYGFKPNDRFRVVVPLGAPLPCYLLQNRRVKNNLLWHFPHVDQCCFDRGHWQILPCVRAEDAPYVHIKNDGVAWGNAEWWAEYARWVKEDQEEFARRKEEAKEKLADVDTETLLHWMENELREVPVGAGVRYAATKRILAKYAHRGIGEILPTLPCPWTDKKWQKQWNNLTMWASTIC